MNEAHPQETAAERARERRRLRRQRRRNILMNLSCICIALSGIWLTAHYFWRHIRYEITNDAFIDQYVAPLNIRVAGYIKEVRFTGHQYVRQGDTLLLLDSREYQIKQKQAEAALLDAHGQQAVLQAAIEGAKTNIAVQEAAIAEAAARLWQLKQDYLRFDRLLKEESISRQQYEQSKAAYDAADARYRSLVAQKEAAELHYAESDKKRVSAAADILRKEADLDLARLNLSYTTLTAPYSGYMGRRTLEAGQYVAAGQTISYLVRNTDKWVTANYKETQIASIYIGQAVQIKVDALPGKLFSGRVTAISEATGSKYSLVPTDNSAGNFVKVQQRIPVRIELTDVSPGEMSQLRAGMMVECEALRR
ncbi:MAG: HlyD family secretion protein [Prevotellaceae bacterium]|jgi:membrane fusion protein (multidrug efflux system)|nr:HlyD family secretion protein [Prevotellaceae bacterium]